MKDADAKPDPQGARPYRARYGRIFLALALLLLALVSDQIYASRLTARTSATTSAKNLTLAVESELNGDLEAATLALSGVAASLDTDAMRPSTSGRYRAQVVRWLTTAIRGSPSACILRIFDATGNRLYTSVDGDTTGSITDRKYFEQLRGAPVGEPMFSDVTKDRATARAVIFAAEPIRSGSGAFLGVAEVGIDLVSLQGHFRGVVPGSDGVAVLQRLEDGAPLLRYPGSIAIDNIADGDIPTRQAILTNAPDHVIEIASPVDGVERIYAVKPVGTFPFSVSVGIASSDYLAQWRGNSMVLLLSSILFLAILAVVLRRLAIADSLRDATAEALRGSLRLLNESQAIGKEGTWEYHVATGRMTWTEEVYRIYEVDRDYDPGDLARNISFCDPDDRAAVSRGFERLLSHAQPYDLEARFTGAKGTQKWVRINARAEFENGKVRRVIGNIQDITNRKSGEVHAGFLATHDRLTELPNRELFYDRLSQSISRARRKKERLAVFLLDLDDFKPINDKSGHAAGDLALVMVARRLQGCVRNMDTVARLGGDEFAIILGEMTNPADAIVVAEKIIRSVSEPLKLRADLVCQIGISTGIAVFPDNGSEIDKLVNAADRAMYESKARGKNTYTVSSEKTSEEREAESWIDFETSLLVGAPEIDEQHHMIAILLNKLNSAIKRADAPAELTTRLLDEMVDYTRYHFESEEHLMQRAGYPEFAGHKRAHEKLLEEAMYLRTKLVQGGELVVLKALKDWFVFHILHSDRPLAEYLAQQHEPARAPAAEVPEPAH